MAIILEMDFAIDAVREVSALHRALTGRHEPKLRELRHKIEMWARGDQDPPTYANIGGGYVVALAPARLIKFIKEARRLGIVVTEGA